MAAVLCCVCRCAPRHWRHNSRTHNRALSHLCRWHAPLYTSGMPQNHASPARAVVFGASSQIGHFVVPQLVDQQVAVVALGRTAAPPRALKGVAWLQARLPDAVPALPEAAVIFSLGPLDLFARWLDATLLAGAPVIVAVSSMSAVSKAAAPLPAERALAARLRDAEQRLLARCAALGLACTILRPTLIYGVGMDRSLSPWARAALRWHVMPLPQARGLRQPLHVEDLAAAVLAAWKLAPQGGRCIEIGGGERLSVNAMFARVHASLPGRSVPLVVPHWCLKLLGNFAPWAATAAKIARFDTNLIADNTVLQRSLGIRPRGFAPTMAAWYPPLPPDAA